MRRRSLISIVFAALVLACGKHEAEVAADEPYLVHLPAGAPPLPVPVDNQLTEARVALGRELFFDERLSLGKGISCASCHFESRAFSDSVALSTGADGALGFRNAPTLANMAWHTSFFRDGGVPTLEQQVLAPIHEEAEMASNIITVAETLREVEPFASLSMKGYGRQLDGYVITRAIACYERTLVSGWSRFDRYYYEGDAIALSEAELRGWNIFNSTDAACNTCHAGFDLSDHSFRNIGITLDHTADPGRERITLDPADRGRFKVPTLRNVALTAPYMHDGSMATLEEVIEHFAAGGVDDPNKDPLVHALALTAQDKSDLLAFLNALTDDRSLDQVP